MSLYCPEDHIDDSHVERIVELTSFNDPNIINNYLMENSDEINDDYSVVALVMFYLIKFDFPITNVQTLLGTFCGDVGNCVNGYTSLQTMVLCNKSIEYVKAAVAAGIFVGGFSENSNDRVIKILCDQLMEMDNYSTINFTNCLDIIQFLLRIDFNLSVKEIAHLAFIHFNLPEIICAHDLSGEIERLKIKSNVFKALTLRLKIYGNEIILEGNKYTIRLLLKLKPREVAKVLQNTSFSDSLDSKLSRLQIFDFLLTAHFVEANRLALKINKFIHLLKDITRLNHDCVQMIAEYLSEDDLEKFIIATEGKL